jgi:ADP-ribose pyrophosphatase YjhB (NUDIX family)
MNKTFSAGGVVISSEGKVLVVNQDNRSWSLPKGHVDDGEKPEAAAAREIGEEAGVRELTLIKPLGSYERHRIGLAGSDDTSELKHISFFLFTTPQLRLAPMDPRHPEARWLVPREVVPLLTHPKDKAFFESIQSVVEDLIAKSGAGQQ